MRALLTAHLSHPYPALEDRSKYFNQIAWEAGVRFDHDAASADFLEQTKEGLIKQLADQDQVPARTSFVTLLQVPMESTYGLAFSSTSMIDIRLFNHDVMKLQRACELLVKSVREAVSKPDMKTPPGLRFSRVIEVREVANDREVFRGHVSPFGFSARLRQVWRERQLELLLMIVLLPLSAFAAALSHPSFSPRPPDPVPELWIWWHGFWERGTSALLVASFTYGLVSAFQFFRGLTGRSIIWNQPGG